MGQKATVHSQNRFRVRQMLVKLFGGDGLLGEMSQVEVG